MILETIQFHSPVFTIEREFWFLVLANKSFCDHETTSSLQMEDFLSNSDHLGYEVSIYLSNAIYDQRVVAHGFLLSETRGCVMEKESLATLCHPNSKKMFKLTANM